MKDDRSCMEELQEVGEMEVAEKRKSGCSAYFFFNDTATTEIYTLSLHDALPIFSRARKSPRPVAAKAKCSRRRAPSGAGRSATSTKIGRAHV